MRTNAAILVILTLFLLSALPIPAKAATPELTQLDLMSNLVDTLGYSFGLPDSPIDSDYIKLLDGTRSYRFEAESCRNPEDLVAVNSFSSFGEFSDPGWVSATSSPTTMRMNFLLPHTGTYRLFAAVRLPGHTLTMEGQSWHISENHPKFQRVDLGEIMLTAGIKELTIAMPANGSIDYIELLAPPSTSIMPLNGWEPSAPMTYADLAVTVIRSLDLESLLPLQGEKILIEAEENTVEKTFLTNQHHLGEPHGGFWLRSGAGGGIITLTFSVETGGVYTLNLIAGGAVALTGTLDGRDPWRANFSTYLKEGSIGTWFLTPGQHQLTIELPPRGGVDLLTLVKRRSMAADYRILAGLPPHDNERLATTDVNRILTLLARLKSRD